MQDPSYLVKGLAQGQWAAKRTVGKGVGERIQQFRALAALPEAPDLTLTLGLTTLTLVPADLTLSLGFQGHCSNWYTDRHGGKTPIHLK